MNEVFSFLKIGTGPALVVLNGGPGLEKHSLYPVDLKIQIREPWS